VTGEHGPGGGAAPTVAARRLEGALCGLHVAAHPAPRTDRVASPSQAIGG